jgi:hypothetical protein
MARLKASTTDPTMIYPGEFPLFVLEATRWPADQQVMARVALNFLFDPEQYPVDLSEVLSLQSNNRIMTEAFFANCASFPIEAGTWPREDFLCEAMRGLVEGASTSASSHQGG